jgi:hypothetical protein
MGRKFTPEVDDKTCGPYCHPLLQQIFNHPTTILELRHEQMNE